MSGFEVRALDWNMSVDGRRLSAAAFGIDVFYLIKGDPEDWTLIKPARCSYECIPGFKAQSAAKEAAQADCEARLREMITPRTEENAQ